MTNPLLHYYRDEDEFTDLDELVDDWAADYYPEVDR